MDFNYPLFWILKRNVLNLNRFRKQKKLSQKELAGKLEVGVTTISNWETGVSQPSIEHLLKLSQILEVTVDQLIENPYTPPPIKGLAQVGESPGTYGKPKAGYLEDRVAHLEQTVAMLVQQNKEMAKKIALQGVEKLAEKLTEGK